MPEAFLAKTPYHPTQQLLKCKRAGIPRPGWAATLGDCSAAAVNWRFYSFIPLPGQQLPHPLKCNPLALLAQTFSRFWTSSSKKQMGLNEIPGSVSRRKVLFCWVHNSREEQQPLLGHGQACEGGAVTCLFKGLTLPKVESLGPEAFFRHTIFWMFFLWKSWWEHQTLKDPGRQPRFATGLRTGRRNCFS